MDGEGCLLSMDCGGLIEDRLTTRLVFRYREFISKIIRLFVIALALFVIARVYGWAANDSVIKKQVKCKYCRKRISEKVWIHMISEPNDRGMC